MKKKAWLIILGLILTINNNVYALTEETCEEILKDLYYGAQEVILEEAKRWYD